MRPLLDADVLLYEIGYAAEAGWQSAGFPQFDYVEELLVNRINNICALAGGTEPPTFFFTGKTNFRNDIAKLRPYKERPSLKPFHYYNIKAYIKGKYDWRQQEPFEADDLMAIEQTRCGESTIICTRDKDLRQVPGWHYGWELGEQPSFGPELVTETGYIRYTEKKKIKGTGTLFFYAQLLMGDSVDTVPGLPKYGPLKTFKLLGECKDTTEAFNRVVEAYRGLYGDVWKEQLVEQARLLWMVREIKDGQPVMWELPNVDIDNGV